MSNTTKKEDGSLCYKNDLDLPPLDFNTTCVGYARYIFYFNERLPGVSYPSWYEMRSYTELCEVVVLECPSESYGLECKYQCSSHCLNGVTCNHVTGQCENGCAAGWTGTQCNKTCHAGRYGPDCTSNCSGNCRNDDPCNKKNGHCDVGCLPGYRGELCHKVLLMVSVEKVALLGITNPTVVKLASMVHLARIARRLVLRIVLTFAVTWMVPVIVYLVIQDHQTAQLETTLCDFKEDSTTDRTEG
ncbi:platelet endothelial aggregation receptor 1-like [Saccostrea echinata]|uniref:platelet endothelial aggregation receptor 1-like n=1 Tax=Saccostrea echinata TaxID=191078 RepID=UPI002A8352E2|nr:platelet endothelial aggregation receptor 1-like [Saccostrea echinata]